MNGNLLFCVMLQDLSSDLEPKAIMARNQRYQQREPVSMFARGARGELCGRLNHIPLLIGKLRSLEIRQNKGRPRP